MSTTTKTKKGLTTQQRKAIAGDYSGNTDHGIGIISTVARRQHEDDEIHATRRINRNATIQSYKDEIQEELGGQWVSNRLMLGNTVLLDLDNT